MPQDNLTRVAAVALTLVAFGGASCRTASPSADFIYVVSADADTIDALRIDPTHGALTRVKGSPYSSRFRVPMSVLVLPGGTHGFLRLIDGVAQFEISSDGGIASIEDGISIGPRPNHFVLHPSGAYVYGVASAAIAPVAVFARKDDVWQRVPGIHALGPTNTIDLDVDPAGRLLYMLGAAGGVNGFPINPDTGVPESTVAVKDKIFAWSPAMKPSKMYIHPSGAFAYFLGRSLTDRPIVAAYSIDANGRLSEVPNAFADAGTDPRAVAIDPSGRFLYVVDEAGWSIHVFAIDTFGTLHKTATVRASSPLDIVADNSGRFIYVATAREVEAFSIQNVSGLPIPLSGPPIRMEADAAGLFLTPPSGAPAALAVLPTSDGAKALAQ